MLARLLAVIASGASTLVRKFNKEVCTKMAQKELIRNGVIAATAASAIVFASVGNAATSYFENFEALDITSPTALGDAGWLVGGCDPVGCYFAFPAPNGGDAFSAIVTGQGGADQGLQQLSVYNDYNNPAHAAATGDVEAFVFYNIGLLDMEDANTEISFSFDTKAGSIAPPTTARAFLLVQKTSDNSFVQLDIANVDTTNVGADWTTLGTSLLIDPTWVGETLQIGFTSTAREFNPSGVFYDNLNVGAAVVPSVRTTCRPNRGRCPPAAALRSCSSGPASPAPRVRGAKGGAPTAR